MKKLAGNILLAIAIVLAGTTAGQAQSKEPLLYKVKVIQALSTDVYTVYLSRGDLAEIFIVGDGKANLDLYVYDENGYRVTDDESYDVGRHVAFVSKRSGKFTIRIVNRSRVSSGYLIAAY